VQDVDGLLGTHGAAEMGERVAASADDLLDLVGWHEIAHRTSSHERTEVSGHERGLRLYEALP
jgi:hypothetical protein